MKKTQILNKLLFAMTFLSLLFLANAYAYDSSLAVRGEGMHRGGQYVHPRGYSGGYHPEARGAAKGFEAGEGAGAGSANVQEASPFYVNPNQGQPPVNVNVVPQ